MTALKRTAIVTGASQGIGEAIAKRLAADGYWVVGCARTPRAAAAALAELGDTAIGMEVDVSREDDVARLIGTAVDRFGGLDVLVNNAAVYTRCEFLDISKEQWERTLSVNLTGAFLVAQAAARAMLDTDSASRGGGRIVNVASTAGLRAKTDSADYNASKAGLVSLTGSMAAELGRLSLVITCVAPGWIDTGIEPLLPLLKPEDFERLNPQGRVGTPAEVAHAVSALCHPDASFMNGAVVSVDGGQIAVSRSP